MPDYKYGEKGSRQQHKIRVLTSNLAGPVLGISLPTEKVKHFKDCWFTTRVVGSTLVLESGAKA